MAFVCAGQAKNVRAQPKEKIMASFTPGKVSKRPVPSWRYTGRTAYQKSLWPSKSPWLDANYSHNHLHEPKSRGSSCASAQVPQPSLHACRQDPFRFAAELLGSEIPSPGPPLPFLPRPGKSIISRRLVARRREPAGWCQITFQTDQVPTICSKV